MSLTSNTPSTSSNFRALFDTALIKYTKRTGQDLRDHPLAYVIDRCDSPGAILAIFQEQSRVFDEFRNGDPKLVKWLGPAVNGLHAISTNAALSAGASLAFPPANVIFSAVGVLLSTAKYVRSSYDTLVDVFECIENFTRRLMIYTQIQPTPLMTETIVKILIEMLAVLALATKQINQGCIKKFARKLLGEQDVESILQRLDRLTLEESKMAVTQTLDVVHGLVNNMEVVMEDGKASTDDIQQILVLMQEQVMKVNKTERNQVQDKVQRWLSAPDPWTNHHIARKAHCSGTATWFIQGDVFAKWQSTGCLLWVQGLPGSGKTVLSSSIIKKVHDMRQKGLAMLSFFYFDFRDYGKQELRHLLSSILIQLCHQSDEFSEILSTLFENHSRGSHQPSEEALLECLIRMLTLPGQGALYLIIDALDECPNSSGYPTQRKEVLAVMQTLINLRLPHVHLCITSRPEVDIRAVLEPLAIHNVRLHEQPGQNQDIIDYINHVLQSDTSVRRWRAEDKQLVIETLTQKASGMFRWVHCQVETLCRCFPPSIRHILGELPKTLDETYERILLEIDEEKQPFARQLFQCLVVSIRPLRVEELAELFAVLPDADLTPGFNAGWRPENPEEFILSACSTLVVIVEVDGNKVAQFAHFSVREYLTSNRISHSAPVSHFHVLPKPAHTLLVKACLSTLIQLDCGIDKAKIQNFPLALYAAKHWMDHARFEGVSSDIQDGVDCLFDRNKPHLAAWIWLYSGMDSEMQLARSPSPKQPDSVPLYYAALCGIHDLVERLLHAHPQDLNARGGYYKTPLLAALNREHPNIALFLLERGADVEPRGGPGQTALYVASSRGYTHVVRSLIDRGVDMNAECYDRDENGAGVKLTPLLAALERGRPEIARLLSESGADVECRGSLGHTPLYMASSRGYAEVVQSISDRGADPNALCDDWDDACLCDVKFTPLLVAAQRDMLEITRILLERGAELNYQDGLGRSALYFGLRHPSHNLARLLLGYGADPNPVNHGGDTALHEASLCGQISVMSLLLEYGANVDAWDEKRWTPLHWTAGEGLLDVVQLLLNHGADVNARTEDHWTALHVTAVCGRLQVAQVLLKCGADPHAQTHHGETPFQLARGPNSTQIKRLLQEHTGERMRDVEMWD